MRRHELGGKSEFEARRISLLERAAGMKQSRLSTAVFSFDGERDIAIRVLMELIASPFCR